MGDTLQTAEEHGVVYACQITGVAVFFLSLKNRLKNHNGHNPAKILVNPFDVNKKKSSA